MLEIRVCDANKMLPLTVALASRTSGEFKGISLKDVSIQLEEELDAYRFGQGVYSMDDWMALFCQLHDDEKNKRYLLLTVLLERLNPVESDMQQAAIDNSLSHSPILDVALHNFRSKTGVHESYTFTGTELEQAYRLLLNVFKQAYQRLAASEKANPTNWRYWDLSNPDVVQRVLHRHQTIVDEVYNDSSFRSEFTSLAKLTYQLEQERQTRHQDPAPDPQSRFDFVSYTEMMGHDSYFIGNKAMLSYMTLRNSVERALAKRYVLDPPEAIRVVLDVEERHLKEKYGLDT